MWSACWAFARRKDVICVAEAKKWLLQNHASIHRWCILEKHAHVANMIDRQQESLQSGDLSAMHKVTRFMTQGPGSNRKSAFRVGGGPEGSSNHNMEKQVFRSHFARLLDAKDVSFEEMVMTDRIRAKEEGSVRIPQESPQEPSRRSLLEARSLLLFPSAPVTRRWVRMASRTRL